MSNPGVVVLAALNNKKGYFKRFQIEDNIGECIHLHIDSIRFDLTISEFMELCFLVRKALDELNVIKGCSIDSLDERFLSRAMLKKKSENINASIKDFCLSDLKFIVKKKIFGLYYFKIVSIAKTPQYKYMNGSKDEYLQYDQYSYSFLSNEDRISKLSDSIKMNGYPVNEKYIVKYSSQPIVRDGMHRAACLAQMYGLEYRVKVLEMEVDDNFNAIASAVRTNLNVFVCYIRRITIALILKYKNL